MFANHSEWSIESPWIRLQIEIGETHGNVQKCGYGECVIAVLLEKEFKFPHSIQLFASFVITVGSTSARRFWRIILSGRNVTIQEILFSGFNDIHRFHIYNWIVLWTRDETNDRLKKQMNHSRPHVHTQAQAHAQQNCRMDLKHQTSRYIRAMWNTIVKWYSQWKYQWLILNFRLWCNNT